VSGQVNLRNDGEVVDVTCLAGTVDVACNGQATILRANQRTRYSARGLASVTVADIEEVGAWQRGVLVFRNQSLQYVVDEVNRYRPGKIVILKHELGIRQVAFASFHLDRLDQIIPQMTALYGASARHLPGGIVLLS
jgi:transmembrane sensor